MVGQRDENGIIDNKYTSTSITKNPYWTYEGDKLYHRTGEEYN